MRVLAFDGTPPAFEVGPDEVHLWLVRLDGAVDEACLSNAERERAGRFRDAKHARRYVAAHVGMRSILAAYVNQAPGSLLFMEEAQGKPALASGPAFNLTHTDERAILAVHGGACVGVDLERPRVLSDFTALAAMNFTAEEARAVAGEHIVTSFFTVWTRKEAALKATGDGLTVDLRTVHVGAEPDSRTIRFGARTLNVESFSTEDGHIGALAVASPRKIPRIGSFDAGCVI